VRLPRGEISRFEFGEVWVTKGSVEWEYSQTFLPNPGSVGNARRFAASTMGEWGLEPDDVALAVSELATNAFRHGCSPFTVSLFRGGLDGRDVVVEVADESQAPPSKTVALPTDTTGRGLMLIDAISADWGFRPSPGGKVVWARFDCPFSRNP
jgi:anti-sigma regulatory factor (Ser/Thr protein kinase)